MRFNHNGASDYSELNGNGVHYRNPNILDTITLKCSTQYTLKSLEEAGVSYVPCTYESPVVPYAHLMTKTEQIHLKALGESPVDWVVEVPMQGVQIVTGKPTFRVCADSPTGHLYLMDIDIENSLKVRHNAVYCQIIQHIYNSHPEGVEPCHIRTKSGGDRFSLLVPGVSRKISYSDDEAMLLEFFSAKGLSRIDNRYAQVKGSLLDIPEFPSPHAINTLTEKIIELLEPIATRNQNMRSHSDAPIVETSQIGELKIDWRKAHDQEDGSPSKLLVSQLFPTQHCQITQHKSNRDEVQFTKYPNGKVMGKCFNCDANWIEVKGTPPKSSDISEQSMEKFNASEHPPYHPEQTKQKPKGFVIKSKPVSELMQKVFPEPKWFVERLIPEGLTLLAGPSKIGKSFLAWNLACAIAHGGVALSSIPVSEKRKVLYMALEDPEQQLQERLDMMCPDGVPTDLEYVTHSEVDGLKMNSKGLESLETYINETGIEMVIIDTWQHLCPPTLKKGTSYETDYETMIPVRNLAHDHNIGILLVMHTTKGQDVLNPFNNIQGSTGNQAGSDTMLLLSRGQQGPTLHVTGRRILEEEYALTLSDGVWKLEGDAEEYRRSDERNQLLDILREAGIDGCTVKDLSNETKKDSGWVSRALKSMARDGLVTQPKTRGKWYINDNASEQIGF